MPELLFKELSFAIVGAAMEVHRVLGPGFLEAVYQKALEHELTLRGIPFVAQQRLPVTYKGRVVGDYVADLVVDDQIIVELKAIAALTGVHTAQALNYLAATGLRLAILLNPSAVLRTCFGAGSLDHQRVVK
jgi:GxxExxY protein